MHQATHISPSDIKPVLGVFKSILGAFAHASKASHTHARRHAHAHAHTHTPTRTHTHAHAHPQAHTGAGACTQVRTHAGAQAHAHVRTHAYTCRDRPPPAKKFRPLFSPQPFWLFFPVSKFNFWSIENAKHSNEI
jgi:hypothetical protein